MPPGAKKLSLRFLRPETPQRFSKKRSYSDENAVKAHFHQGVSLLLTPS
ncbi:MAG: hypothetical protein IKV51_02125 [Clostridia bacterium]|nr:hypothetical protein [Clostridia bacterium]